MVLFFQLLVVAVCGGFILLVVRDEVRTNIALSKGDVADLEWEARRHAVKRGGENAVAAAKYCAKRAEKRLARVERWGF